MYAQNCVDIVFLYDLIGHRIRVIFFWTNYRRFVKCRTTTDEKQSDYGFIQHHRLWSCSKSSFSVLKSIFSVIFWGSKTAFGHLAVPFFQQLLLRVTILALFRSLVFKTLPHSFCCIFRSSFQFKTLKYPTSDICMTICFCLPLCFLRLGAMSVCRR